jgi:hypothetical protein
MILLPSAKVHLRSGQRCSSKRARYAAVCSPPKASVDEDRTSFSLFCIWSSYEWQLVVDHDNTTAPS